MKGPEVKKGRCTACGGWNVCHEVAPGNWTCSLCVAHVREDYSERDRVERRVRQLEEEERKMSSPITMTERERVVRARYGFTEADMMDPLRGSMVQNLARTDARMAAAKDQEALEDEVAAVGRELGLDPEVHHERCRIFTELVKRGHPIARERYGRPTT